MPNFTILKRSAAVLVFAASAAIPIAAVASPPVNFSGEGLAAGDFDQEIHLNSERIKFQTKDPVDVVDVRLEWGAGGRSGWHHHPGMVIVVVSSGLVTVKLLDCSTKSYGPGSPNGSVFIEGEATHQVTSTAGAVAFATAIVANDQPARIEDPVPFCP
jgi:quercetin dioxygenase-like cupin family protein